MIQQIPSIRPESAQMRQPIPETFTYDGYVHRLVVRSGRRAIFSKARPHSPIHSYEVVLLEYRGAEIIGGKAYPARETYPRSEDWGVAGWTCSTLDEARRKLDEISK
jgi:hypothetical protein